MKQMHMQERGVQIAIFFITTPCYVHRSKTSVTVNILKVLLSFNEDVNTGDTDFLTLDLQCNT